MENATKALLIAATVLIAIIMVTIAVHLYSMYSNQAEEYSETITAVELEKFNSKFDVYIGRDDIKAQEIVSVVNLAKEYDYQIKIYVSGTILKFDTSYTQEDFIKAKQNKLFSCTLNTSEENPNPTYDGKGRITKLIFREN